MGKFLTVDLNGWLDHVVDGGKARAIGFRTCMLKHEDVWLVGDRALSAARFELSSQHSCSGDAEPQLMNMGDALKAAAGEGNCAEEDRAALPNALWQLVEETTKSGQQPLHLAIVIPDNPLFGTPTVRPGTGKTSLETLHETFVRARPNKLRRCRFELVWRSVAALKAAMGKDGLGEAAGAVLVINVDRSICWNVLELRPWPPNGHAGNPLCIVRRPEMQECEEGESWAARRIVEAWKELEEQRVLDITHAVRMNDFSDLCRLSRAVGPGDIEAICRWTRLAELLATDMPLNSLEKLGIHLKGPENQCWPTRPANSTIHGNWQTILGFPSAPKVEGFLPHALENSIRMFRDGNDVKPLGIVVESPVEGKMTAGLVKLVRQTAGPLLHVWSVTCAATALAADTLAVQLGQKQDSPAWLDHVPCIEMRVRDPEGDTRGWKQVIKADEAIPAGKTYKSKLNKERRVSLAPGIEHIHIHLRRGRERNWDERYSGRNTGHTIQPSDHEMVIEPRATVRPLSGAAQIEFAEHLPNGATPILAAPINWGEMAVSEPEELRSIPELYIFKASKGGWNDLKPLLKRVVDAGEGNTDHTLRDALYMCTKQQWQGNLFPLGSDGRPPRADDRRQHESDRKLLAEATRLLSDDLKRFVDCDTPNQWKGKKVNRLHLPLTWLFTGCPRDVVRVLLDAMVNPEGRIARRLRINLWPSKWSIYQGVGRAVQDEAALRTVFDDLICRWEQSQGQQRDQCLLAAVSHPMARRVVVRNLLKEDEERFERVKRFFDRHLEILFEKAHDTRKKQLDLRYITMGYRGLCQIRHSNPDWFPVDNCHAKMTHDRLCRVSEMATGAFVRELVTKTAPYIIGEGNDPTMPGGF
ncbi:MAG: hypothetical protein OXB95_00885 [Rhodobacteraceae bacterium]|nr:hypothetical protein [Paracoccaceae bacterium]